MRCDPVPHHTVAIPAHLSLLCSLETLLAGSSGILSALEDGLFDSSQVKEGVCTVTHRRFEACQSACSSCDYADADCARANAGTDLGNLVKQGQESEYDSHM